MDDDFWKCPKHPSRRQRVGICATCLRDRLLSLCPNCSNSIPCSCFPHSTTASSSYSSSFSRFSVDTSSSSLGAVGRVSAFIESEPSFCRSRSAAVPSLLSSRFSNEKQVPRLAKKTGSTVSFWSLFGGNGKNEVKMGVEDKTVSFGADEMGVGMMRSKSVSVWRASVDGGKGVKGSLGNSKGWHFPSPIKVFRQSKPRSPLYRG